MLLLYILSGLALIQGIVSLGDGRRNMRYAIGYRRGSGPDGSVVVFCPVKGAEGDLETNARSLLAQTHPDYRVVFIVESDEDPARVAEMVRLGENTCYTTQAVRNPADVRLNVSLNQNALTIPD